VTPELGLAQVDLLRILTRVDKRHKTGIMEANLSKPCVTFLSANTSDMRRSFSAIISPATVPYKYRKKLTMEILFSSPTRTCQKLTRTLKLLKFVLILKECHPKIEVVANGVR